MKFIDPDGMAPKCCGQLEMASRDPGLDAIDATPAERREYQTNMGVGFALGAIATATTIAVVEAAPYVVLETSRSSVLVNIATDGVMQTAMNATEGKDPIANYDVTGLGTGFLRNPIITSAVDGAVDISSQGFEVNSVPEIIASIVVGGAHGRGAAKLTDAIPNDAGQANNVASMVLGIYANGAKSAAGEGVKEESIFQVPFVSKQE